MPDQLSFDGMEPPTRGPAPLDPLIFAVQPAAAARPEIAACYRALAAAHGLAGRPIDQARLHITLQWLPFPRDRVTEFVALAARIVSELDVPTFEISLREGMSFRSATGNYPFVLRAEAEGLSELFQALGTGMRRLGFGRFARKSFTPHLTLLYDRIQAPAQPIEAISWTATELVLIHSVQGESRHDVLAGWPLAMRN